MLNPPPRKNTRENPKNLSGLSGTANREYARDVQPILRKYAETCTLGLTFGRVQTGQIPRMACPFAILELRFAGVTLDMPETNS